MTSEKYPVPFSSLDGDGHETQYKYDADNRLTVTTDALNNHTTLTLDGNANTVKVTDGNSNSTSYLYDAENRLTLTLAGIAPGTTVWLSATSQMYDGASNVTASFDGDGHETKYQYDALNRLTVTTDALNNHTTVTLDGAGNTVKVTDGNTNSASFLYDADNRLTLTLAGIAPGTTVWLSATSQMYDKVSNLTASFDGNGHESKYQYDADNRLTVTTDALNNHTTLTLDGQGNTVKVTDASGNSTSYLYDALSRLTLTLVGIAPGTTAWLSATSQMYDGANNPIGSFDGDGHETQYQYDGDNRLTVTIYADSTHTTQLYDGVGNMTYLKDADNNVTTFAYDAENRQMGETNPNSFHSTYAYDGASNLTLSIDRDARAIAYHYDAVNRQTGQTWYSGSALTTATIVQLLTASYDAVGNQLTAADGAGTYTMTYDALNRVTLAQDVGGLALTFSYDAAGNRTLVKYQAGDGQIVGPTLETSVYDTDNRLSQREEAVIGAGGSYEAELLATMSYLGNGLLSRIQGAGIEDFTPFQNYDVPTPAVDTQYQYDAADRITGLVLGMQVIPSPSIAYSYDGAGLLTGQVSSDPSGYLTTFAYTYNSTNELTSGAAITYSYDSAGNRTTVVDDSAGGPAVTSSYATTTGNQTSSDGTWSYTYDNAGNITQKLDTPGGLKWTFTYDNRNEMTGATESVFSSSTWSPSVAVTYKYDYFGNMVAEQTATYEMVPTYSENDYDYDGWNPALAAATGLSKWVVWGESLGGAFNQNLHGDRVGQFLGQLNDGGTAAWFLQDRQNSVMASTDAYGNPTTWTLYDGYGNVWGAAGTAPPTEYGFQGARYDGATNLSEMGARFYDPTTGKWTSQDPIGFNAGDPNLYGFVFNSPTNGTDSSGLDWRPQWLIDAQNDAKALLDTAVYGVQQVATAIENRAQQITGTVVTEVQHVTHTPLSVLPQAQPEIGPDPRFQPQPVPPFAGGLPLGPVPAPPTPYYIDVGGFVPVWPLPLVAGGGITGGVQWDSATGVFHPYLGVGVGTVGGSVTVAPGQSVSTGPQVGVGGFFPTGDIPVGPGFQLGYGTGGSFLEIGVGTTGAGLVFAWVF